MLPLTEQEAFHAKMAALYSRTHGPECPDKYRAIAEWWRLYAEETKAPEECLRYAEGQDTLATDMEARPEHYRAKPVDQTNWQWMQK